VNGIFSLFSAATSGVDVFGRHLTVPQGTANIVLGVLMAVVLILVGGRELTIPERWLRRGA
jgi:hypothetical protein